MHHLFDLGQLLVGQLAEGTPAEDAAQPDARVQRRP